MSERWAAPTLVGELVVLRPVRAEDASAMWEAVRDPEGRRLTGTTASFTYEQVERWAATRAAAQDRIDLAVVERATGEYAGEAVLNEHDPDTESANFRIALRGPGWYGRGLGTEATRLLVDHGLGPVGLRRITLSVLALNPRAVRAYEKVGFREVGRAVEDGEEWVDMEVTRAPER